MMPVVGVTVAIDGSALVHATVVRSSTVPRALRMTAAGVDWSPKLASVTDRGAENVKPVTMFEIVTTRDTETVGAAVATMDVTPTARATTRPSGSTLAIVESSLRQVIGAPASTVPSLFTVTAVNCTVSWKLVIAVSLPGFVNRTVSGAFVTVSTNVRRAVSRCAMMFVVPTANALTTPFALTLATLGLLAVQLGGSFVRSRSLPYLSSSRTCITSESPMARRAIADGVMAMMATAACATRTATVLSTTFSSPRWRITDVSVVM